MKKILRFFFYLYLIYASILFILMVIELLIIVSFTLIFNKKTRYKITYWIYHYAFKIHLGLIGIFIINIYESNEAKDNKNLVFVSNHLSYLDAGASLIAIKKVFRPLGKHEVAKIPLIGFLYCQFVITVNRGSIKSKVDSLKEMDATLAENSSILIYPEGTFHEKINCRLNPFKDGAFHLAIENKVPIQGIVFKGTREVLHPRGLANLKPGIVKAYFLNPIHTNELNIEDAKLLKEKVYQAMLKKLNELDYPKLDL